MTTEKTSSEEIPAGKKTPVRALSPAAQRALAEAAERRARAEKEAVEAPKEANGRDGPDPVRYGDWESRGIDSDF
jgi:hypothetical protein